ncbi:MAG: type II toxin-antitoxin system VapC family toxin [Anaerolineales bacterium]|nr:type II toxin-antitoxin system VapC family toxin [Anaerolineales bacterium]
MLLDSNIIIYASQPRFANLREFIAETSPYVSAISYVEVLGYHRLTEDERTYFQAFFQAASILPLSIDVVEQAVKLRQLRKMSLGDALVAGTALIHRLTLVTHNHKDFDWIPSLSISNPVDL